MAPELTWTPNAVRDLQAIAAYIAVDSERAARAMVRRLVAAAERAARFPRAGRVVAEVGRQDVRQVIWRSCRIIYRIGLEGVTVLAVAHGARRLEDLLDDML